MTDDRVRAALLDAVRGRPQPGIEVARGTRPRLLDMEGVRALSAPFLAAFLVAAASLRTRMVADALDLWAPLLRTAAIAFSVRACILLARRARRFVSDLAAPAHALAWSADGLLWHGPQGELFIPRREIAGLCVPAFVARRITPEPWRPLWVVLARGSSALYRTIPPYFSASPETLAARLNRTLQLEAIEDPPDAGEPAAPTAPDATATEGDEVRYARAAREGPKSGETVIPEGRGYLLRGPYTSLLGAVFALDALLRAGALRSVLWTPVLLSCFVALLAPAGFVWRMHRKARARLGIAMLLADDALLVRGEHGVVSTPWSELDQVEVLLREVWSPFVGTYTIRHVVMTHRGGERTRFDESFLGAPAEVVAQMCAGYRKGKHGARFP